MTYDKMITYVDDLPSQLAETDGAIIKALQYSLEDKEKKVKAENVILFTDSARALLSQFSPLYGNIIGFIAMGAGAGFWIYYNHTSRKFEMMAMEGQNEIINTKLALRYMKADIESQGYIGKNYYFISMNNKWDEPGVVGTFAKKEGLTYSDSSLYNETYFNTVASHIDVVLEKIENGDFSNNKSYKPDETRLNELKHTRNVAISTSVLTEIFEGLSITKVIDAEKVAGILKERFQNLSREDAKEIAETMLKKLFKGDWRNILKKAGESVIFTLFAKELADKKKEGDAQELEKELDENDLKIDLNINDLDLTKTAATS